MISEVGSPLVSVLMTVYNREKYISQAIESVLASIMDDFELIIVDDCSSDCSMDIARKYMAIDSRIQIYVNKSNLGDYPNRNKAASLAKGKYLKYVDADDMIYPQGLKILVETMECFPNAGYGLCSLEQDKFRMYPFELLPEEAYYRHYFEQPLFHKAPLSAIFRKDAFNAVGGFSGKQHVGDFEMWHVLSNFFPVVLMQQGVAWYREHEDQQMNDNRTNIAVPFKYLKLAVEMLKSEGCPLSSEDKTNAENNIIRQQARTILRVLISHGPKKANELLSLSKLSKMTVLSKAFSKRLTAVKVLSQ